MIAQRSIAQHCSASAHAEGQTASAAGSGSLTRFAGWVDHIEGGIIHGWATDHSDLLGSAHLVYLLGRRIVGVGQAEQDREDVARALRIPARCGFIQLLPPDALENPAKIAVLAVDPEVARRVASALEAGEDHGTSIDEVVRKGDESLVHPLPMAPDALTGIKVPLKHLNLRKLATKAQDAGNWSAAAFFFGKATSSQPDDAELWMQHGDMLRLSGLFEKAKLSYERAAALLPTETKALSCLASLAIARADLKAAITYLERSEPVGSSNSTSTRRELDALRGSGRRPVVSGRNDDLRIYLSSVAKMPPEGDPAALKRVLGATHYSYSYIMKGYLSALEDAGFSCTIIENPEYFPDISTKHDGVSIHIGFYPPNEPRLLKGSYNIICIAWEFERFKSSAEIASYYAFSDSTQMLSCSSEVWAISQFGAEAATRSGVANVYAVPTPVPTSRNSGRSSQPSLVQLQKAALKLDRINWHPLAIFPEMQKTLSKQSVSGARSLIDVFHHCHFDRRPIVFYCVFNVHDYRKQIRPLLEAFVRLSQTNTDAYLLLKITSIDSATHDVNTQLCFHQINDPGELIPPLVSDHVLFTTDTLSRDEMSALSELSSYYVCTSHAEGQNLPLIEAMGAGVVPVSVDNTAMKEYISDRNAIIIPSRLDEMTPRLSMRYQIFGVHTYYVTATEVYKAMDRALFQTTAEYSLYSERAIDTVRQKFGYGPFLDALRASIERATSRLKPS